MPTTPEDSPIHGDDNVHPERKEIDHLIEFMKDKHERGVSAFDFELKLHTAGLLVRLEEAGIVPKLTCPNPYDPEREEGLHNQWWDEHEQEAAEYSERFHKREETIRYMYFGTLLATAL